MHSIRDNRLDVLEVKGSTVALLSRLRYMAGQQANAVGVQSEVYDDLRDAAIIQGTRSSNEVEGLRVDDGRYGPLVQGRIEPADRTEKLVLGGPAT